MKKTKRFFVATIIVAAFVLFSGLSIIFYYNYKAHKALTKRVQQGQSSPEMEAAMEHFEKVAKVESWEAEDPLRQPHNFKQTSFSRISEIPDRFSTAAIAVGPDDTVYCLWWNRDLEKFELRFLKGSSKWSPIHALRSELSELCFLSNAPNSFGLWYAQFGPKLEFYEICDALWDTSKPMPVAVQTIDLGRDTERIFEKCRNVGVFPGKQNKLFVLFETRERFVMESFDRYAAATWENGKMSEKQIIGKKRGQFWMRRSSPFQPGLSPAISFPDDKRVVFAAMRKYADSGILNAGKQDCCAFAYFNGKKWIEKEFQIMAPYGVGNPFTASFGDTAYLFGHELCYEISLGERGLKVAKSYRLHAACAKFDNEGNLSIIDTESFFRRLAGAKWTQRMKIDWQGTYIPPGSETDEEDRFEYVYGDSSINFCIDSKGNHHVVWKGNDARFYYTRFEPVE